MRPAASRPVGEGYAFTTRVINLPPASRRASASAIGLPTKPMASRMLALVPMRATFPATLRRYLRCGGEKGRNGDQIRITRGFRAQDAPFYRF